MSTPTTEPGTYSLQKGWRTLALAGGVVALLGLLAILLPLATGIAITYLVGALLVGGGIVHAGHAFTARGWRGSLWQVALAAVSIGSGLLLLVNPVLGLLSLTILAIAYLLVDGIAELAASLQMDGETGRGWIAASGVTSLVLAGLLWIGFPADAAWAIGLLVGISLLMTGLSMVAVAYGGRRLDEDVAGATEPRGA
ncbi:HdeD family acid-resistance protein [Natronococcus sp.]|uniref:HdeD family acid-resistance protein n=1 Tax=Natronococcus sp. TaxID=35747 RepID=UPI003A4D6FBA